MANARTTFDALHAALLVDSDVRDARLNGKRALALEGDAFLMWYRDSLSLRLFGRALVKARAIDGSLDFDPMNPEEATMTRPGWVRLPASAFGQWEPLAFEALRCAREARWKNVSWELPSAEQQAQVDAAAAAAAAKKLADMAKRAQIGVEWGFDFGLEPLPS
jgi:hypothetical protein